MRVLEAVNGAPEQIPGFRPVLGTFDPQPGYAMWLPQSQWPPLVRLSTSDSTNSVPTIMLTALGSGTPRRQCWSCESRVCVEKWMLSA